MLRRLASHCYRHRWRVLILWIVLLVGVNVLAKTAGGDLLKTFSLPGTESQRTFDVLKRDFGQQGDTGDLVFKARTGTVESPAVREAITPVIETLRKSPHVVSVTSPYDSAANAFLVSGDKQDRLRRDPVRRAVERRAGRSRDAHPQRRLEGPEGERRHGAGRAGRLHVHRSDAARERAHRHPRRGAHPADRVRIAARDGTADHDRAVRHRHRARARDAAGRASWTSRRSRRRSPR